jgi:hypothetical protein
MFEKGWLQRGVVVLVGILLAAPVADAKRTKLREVDLATGRARSIDGGGPKTRADRALDSLLDSATGGSAFSTKDLAKIDSALRRYLRAARPRAMPRMLLFLYPGRISRAGLKDLREVLVDLDLVVDPCGRNVCQESVGKTLELLGKSLRQAVVRTRKYTIRFKTVTIRTVSDMRGSDPDTYRFGADEVVRSGRTTGGGRKLVRRLTSAKKGYVAEMTKEVSRNVKRRRVALLGSPKIQRTARSVSVSMEIKSDRNRYKSHVGKAMVGAAQALAKSPLTPPSSQLKVVARIRFRKVERRTFSCMGQPLKLHLDGRLSTSELWGNYINELGKKGTRMTFSDEEASGGATSDAGDSGEDRTQEILAAHFNLLAPCLQAEARRNRRFRGVTMKFAVGSSGRATGVGTRERASSTLKRCLSSALSRIRFQRQRGAPRRVEYPMYIQR